MFPTLFQLPLWPSLQASWKVFIFLVVALVLVMSFAPKLGEKNKLLGQLLVILPVAAFATAFIAFVETPFGKMPINSYGFAIMVGFLLCSWVAVRRAKPLGIKSDFILDLGIIAMIAGIIGAKINYLLQYPEEIKGSGKSLWGDMGLNPLGALILGPIPFAFWFWRMKTSGQKVHLYSWQNGVLLVLTLFLALLGTRVLFLYENSGEFNWELFRRWQSGFVLYGGLIAGVSAGVLYIKMRGQSVAQIADLVAPAATESRGTASSASPSLPAARPRSSRGNPLKSPPPSIPRSSTKPPRPSASSSSCPGSTGRSAKRRGRSSSRCACSTPAGAS
jgi:prolipoprotein diacylglyceryltransferase